MGYLLKKRIAGRRRRGFGDDEGDDGIGPVTVTIEPAGTVTNSSSGVSQDGNYSSPTSSPTTITSIPGAPASSSSSSSDSGGNPISNFIGGLFGGMAAGSQQQPGNIAYVEPGMSTTTLLLLAALGIGAVYFVTKKD